MARHKGIMEGHSSHQDIQEAENSRRRQGKPIFLRHDSDDSLPPTRPHLHSPPASQESHQIPSPPVDEVIDDSLRIFFFFFEVEIIGSWVQSSEELHRVEQVWEEAELVSQCLATLLISTTQVFSCLLGPGTLEVQ